MPNPRLNFKPGDPVELKQNSGASERITDFFHVFKDVIIIRERPGEEDTIAVVRSLTDSRQEIGVYTGRLQHRGNHADTKP